MISYCIACYRPPYARELIEDLIRKTTVRFEILLWLNVDDAGLETFIEAVGRSGTSVRVVGKTPENIGMAAYLRLFEQSRFEMVAQIDDDVVCVSPRIAETARDILNRFPRIGMVTADVWQDQYTTGARPPLHHYRRLNAEWGLYEGPIDGWFAIYRKSCLHVCRSISPGRYFPLGVRIKNLLVGMGMTGVLCTGMKVFHVIGPDYASCYGMLDFEIDKYQRLGRHDIVSWYTAGERNRTSREELDARVAGIRWHLGEGFR